jgi:hypothetical protein
MNTKDSGSLSFVRKIGIFCLVHIPAAPKLALHVSLLLVASATQAQSSVDSKYQCVVLGDSRQCQHAPDLPPVRVENRLEPGPHALHFKYLGASTQAAIAQARLLGEVPSCRVVRITTRQLSGTEMHDRSNGRKIIPAEAVETLSLTAVQDEVC